MVSAGADQLFKSICSICLDLPAQGVETHSLAMRQGKDR